MRSIAIRGLVTVAVLILVAVVAWRAISSYSATRAPVRMGYLPMISSLTYFVALDQELFLKRGIEVTGIPITTSNDIAKSLVRGDIDIGIELSVVPLLSHVPSSGDADAPFVIFSTSAITASNGFDGILVLRDSSVKTLCDLAGTPVAVFPGTTAARTLQDVFQSHCPGVPSPTPLPMSPSMHLAALERGEVAGLHAYEPYLTIGILRNGFRRIHTSLYAEQQSPNPIGVAAINRRWQHAHPSAARSAIAALDEAAQFIEAYPDKARMIAAKYTGAEPDVAVAMNIMPMSVSSNIDIVGLQSYFGVLHRMLEISAVPNAEALCRP